MKEGIKYKMPESGFDPELWDLEKRIEFKENRLVLFDASYYHSKSSLRSVGNLISESRIVYVSFFKVEK